MKMKKKREFVFLILIPHATGSDTTRKEMSMSIERNPNINAAGFTSNIVSAYQKYLRGNANESFESKSKSFTILSEYLTEFVINVSEALDKEFEDEGKGDKKRSLDK